WRSSTRDFHADHPTCISLATDFVLRCRANMLKAIFAGTFQTGSGLGKFCESTLYRVSTFANNLELLTKEALFETPDETSRAHHRHRRRGCLVVACGKRGAGVASAPGETNQAHRAANSRFYRRAEGDG